MGQCRALNCKNRGVHLFPKDPIRRKQWECALRIKNFKANNTTRLCAMHFTEEDYFGQSRYTSYAPKSMFLKKTSVPSVFDYNKPKLLNPAALDRQKRMEKRGQRKLVEKDIKVRPHVPQSSETLQECSIMNISCHEENEEIVASVDENEAACSHSLPRFQTKSTQADHVSMYGSIENYKNDDESVKFYTGFESYKKFKFVYSTLSPMAHEIRYYGSKVINLSTEDQFFLCMMKLRQDKCNFELSKFFNISQSTVSNIFITWVNYIYQLWSRINIWPSKELVQYYMPQHFKDYDPNLRVILDGTEVKVQKPKNPRSQQASWSNYKHANTLKILVGASPGGLLSYCSQAYAGSASDRQTVERSDVMSKCQSGDSILADRGFVVLLH